MNKKMEDFATHFGTEKPITVGDIIEMGESIKNQTPLDAETLSLRYYEHLEMVQQLTKDAEKQSIKDSDE